MFKIHKKKQPGEIKDVKRNFDEDFIHDEGKCA